MKKNKLLLLICCGPCASHVINELKKDFSVTGFFFNPNIYPVSEFNKRVSAAQIVSRMTRTKIFFTNYNYDKWLNYVKIFKDEKEGGKRCELCFEYRLRQTAIFGKFYKYNYFASTLSISPHKDAGLINNIGGRFAKEYKIKYLASDFKKNDGFKKSCDLSKKWEIYRQNYCGCEFSQR